MIASPTQFVARINIFTRHRPAAPSADARSRHRTGPADSAPSRSPRCRQAIRQNRRRASFAHLFLSSRMPLLPPNARLPLVARHLPRNNGDGLENSSFQLGSTPTASDRPKRPPGFPLRKRRKSVPDQRFPLTATPPRRVFFESPAISSARRLQAHFLRGRCHYREPHSFS